jgi:hypothetical protein
MDVSPIARVRTMSAITIIGALIVAVMVALGLFTHTLVARWPLGGVEHNYTNTTACPYTDRNDDKYANVDFILVPTSMAASALLGAALSGSQRAAIWAVIIGLVALGAGLYAAIIDIVDPPYHITLTVRIFDWIWVAVQAVIIILDICILITVNRVLLAIRSTLRA